MWDIIVDVVEILTIPFHSLNYLLVNITSFTVVRELNECGIHHTLHLRWVRRPLPERLPGTDDEGKIGNIAKCI